MATGFADVLAAYRETLPEPPSCCSTATASSTTRSGRRRRQRRHALCSRRLFMAADDDPLFLQVKEARPSVLEPYAGKSAYANNGQRVVIGQRIMQAASDVFLGWTRTKAGHDVCPPVARHEDLGRHRGLGHRLPAPVRAHVRASLARAHARSGDAARMAGYMGSGQTFDDAVGEFAVEYADQNRRDFRAFTQAIREGRIQVPIEE